MSQRFITDNAGNILEPTTREEVRAGRKLLHEWVDAAEYRHMKSIEYQGITYIEVYSGTGNRAVLPVIELEPNYVSMMLRGIDRRDKHLPTTPKET